MRCIGNPTERLTTVEPWMRLWGFCYEHVDQVTQQQVDSVRMFVGLNGSVFQTERSEPKGFALLKRDGRGRLDFNAIAQGYTVDLMLEALQREGVRHAMVELGGEVAAGTNAQGEPWRIAVDRPQAEGRDLAGHRASGRQGRVHERRIPEGACGQWPNDFAHHRPQDRSPSDARL